VVHLLGTISLIVGAVASVAFVVVYGLAARFYRSAEGWHLMTFTGAIALILTYTSYRNLAAAARPVSLGVDIARLAIFGVVAVLMLWRFGLLWWIQVRRRGRKRAS
jgi:hypothetical protein